MSTNAPGTTTMQQQKRCSQDILLEKTSIIYPEVRFQDNSLQPMLFTVCFPGTLPRHLVLKNMPIEITVTVCDELRSFTTPVIEAISWSVCDNEHPLHPGSSKEDPLSHQELPIPFLPLPRSFNHRSSQYWDVLRQQIEGWLVTIPSDSQHWTWGRDAFWLAFIGANPRFPFGKWPLWNPKIPLEGMFIEDWLAVNVVQQHGPSMSDELDNTLEQIWIDFHKHVALFFPYPLISDS